MSRLLRKRLPRQQKLSALLLPRKRGALLSLSRSATAPFAMSKSVSYFFSEEIGVYASVEAQILKPHVLKCVAARSWPARAAALKKNTVRRECSRLCLPGLSRAG